MKYLTDVAAGLGLYLHIPFCIKKCAYCDFYSGTAEEKAIEAYTERLSEEIMKWGGRLCRPCVDTIYLGGGTPSLLEDRLVPLLDAARTAFLLDDGAEVTMELNPAPNVSKALSAAVTAGINRLSIGAQSGNDSELALLGRSHTAADTLAAVRTARRYGFDNISLDLMIGLPDSSVKTLEKSLDFILSAQPEHISAYILKLEENTLLYNKRGIINLPEDDETAEQYLYMCRRLESAGYEHYEISNFCLPGRESRHNLKYWRCEEYLGIGPSAHSFIDGKRFYYPRDIKAFKAGVLPVQDGGGGGAEEYIMLRLRLAEGLCFEVMRRRFGISSENMVKAALPLKEAGLLRVMDKKISLTDKGMLVSNSIITELLENCT